MLFRQDTDKKQLTRAPRCQWLPIDKMESDKATYRSFLLRLWQVEQNGDWIWRCSLEETGTGRHRKFVDLEALFDYLNAETAATPYTQEENKR